MNEIRKSFLEEKVFELRLRSRLIFRQVTGTTWAGAWRQETAGSVGKQVEYFDSIESKVRKEEDGKQGQM